MWFVMPFDANDYASAALAPPAPAAYRPPDWASRPAGQWVWDGGKWIPETPQDPSNEHRGGPHIPGDGPFDGPGPGNYTGPPTVTPQETPLPVRPHRTPLGPHAAPGTQVAQPPAAPPPPPPKPTGHNQIVGDYLRQHPGVNNAFGLSVTPQNIADMYNNPGAYGQAHEFTRPSGLKRGTVTGEDITNARTKEALAHPSANLPHLDVNALTARLLRTPV